MQLIAGLQSVYGVAIVFHVGDARVYHWSEGYLMLLTTDDRVSPAFKCRDSVSWRSRSPNGS